MLVPPQKRSQISEPVGQAGSREELSALLASLMERYQAADPEAADALVRLVNPILARFYYALTHNSRQVEDLLQECWLRIHRARQSYRPPEPVLPWILAIARHTRVDQFRHWQRSSSKESTLDHLADPPSSDPRAQIENRLQANAILQVMQSLPEAQREVLMMLKMGGMSVEEVARATGSSSAAVKQKAYRAYQAVRQALGIGQNQNEDAP